MKEKHSTIKGIEWNKGPLYYQIILGLDTVLKKFYAKQRNRKLKKSYSWMSYKCCCYGLVMWEGRVGREEKSAGLKLLCSPHSGLFWGLTSRPFDSPRIPDNPVIAQCFAWPISNQLHRVIENDALIVVAKFFIYCVGPPIFGLVIQIQPIFCIDIHRKGAFERQVMHHGLLVVSGKYFCKIQSSQLTLFSSSEKTSFISP